MIFVFLPIACGQETKMLDNQFIKTVHDGDTYELTNGIKLRLFGVDTPEISDQYLNFVETSGLENLFAKLARSFAIEQLMHQKIDIIYITSDKYHRMISKIIVNHEDLGLLLVKNGLARYAYIDMNPKSPFFSTDVVYYGQLLQAQYYAFAHQLGIWKRPNKFHVIFPKA